MDVMTSNIYRKRVDFSKIKTYLPIPNLIDIQRKSYDDFLQMRELPKDRKDTGLQAAFKSVFNIEDYRGLAKLEFVEYAVGDWECKCGHLKGIEHNRIQCTQCGASVYVDDTTDSYATCGKCGYRNENTVDICPICEAPASLKAAYSMEECEERGMTFAVPMKVRFRLTIFEEPDTAGNRAIRDIKEQELYFGDIP
ncbi:MAG: DNA-directed RNA polymerase subunit beta, partial [Holophagae bacterium]|nr:DNA-directed RNA polymerase subunit beta [Holophagae bacterium]